MWKSPGEFVLWMLSSKTADRSKAEGQVTDSNGLGFEELGTNASCEG